MRLYNLLVEIKIVLKLKSISTSSGRFKTIKNTISIIKFEKWISPKFYNRINEGWYS